MTNSGGPLSLSVRGVTVCYGSIVALRGIDLEVGAGEIVALIGANGAGKTTLMRALSGLVPATGAAVLSQTNRVPLDLLRLEPRQIPAAGVVHVPEGRGIFLNLSVIENLRMGAYLRRDRAGIHQDLERRLVQFPRLRERLHQPALTLSGGEQQMLAIARALMSRPRMILLDEPSLGLAPMLVKEIFATIARLGADGMTILLVEQNARMALRIAQRGYVLETGRIVLAGSAQELANDPGVRAAYLGHHDAPANEGISTAGP